MAIIPKQVLEAARAHHRQLYSLTRAQQRSYREVNEVAVKRLRRQLRELTNNGKAESFKAQQKRIAFLMANAANERLVSDMESFITDVVQQNGRRLATEHVADEVGAWASHYGAELRPINVEAVLQLDHELLIEKYPKSLSTYGQATANSIRTELQMLELTRADVDEVETAVTAAIGRERWRAARIVRTETSHAYNQTHLQGLHNLNDEQGLETAKTCIVTFDARTDDDSRPLEGQVRQLDELFEDGEGRRYQAPPGRPNDREKMVPYMEEDAFDKAAEAAERSGDEPEPEPDQPGDDVRWPDHPGELNRVSSLGGSTGAELYEDPHSGERFVLKRGNSPAHIRNEMAADRAYQAAGINVPPFREYAGPSGEPIKLAKFIEGTPLGQWKPGSIDELKAVNAQLSEGFAMDGLLANWDVIGQAKDNVLIDPDGVPWRIDNGGAMGFRAQGAVKPQWNEYPDDLWSMRNAKINPQAASQFSSVTWADIRQQVDALDTDAVLNALNSSTVDRSIMGERLRQLAEMGELTDTMGADGYKARYLDEFAGHIQGIRSAGITERMPSSLTPKLVSKRKRSDDVRVGDYVTSRVVDDKGQNFDHLRGRDGLVGAYQDYMRRVGGDPGLFQSWAKGQRYSSWNGLPQAFKYHYATNVRGGTSAFYWHEGLDTAKRHHKNMTSRAGAATVHRTFAVQHAFTYEQLKHIDLPQKSKGGAVMRLYRTEDRPVMTRVNNFKVGDEGIQYTKGALESSSVFNPVYVAGDQLVEFKEVPIHRVWTTYFQGQSPGNDQVLLGDGENEMLADLNGVAGDYLASGRPKRY